MIFMYVTLLIMPGYNISRITWYRNERWHIYVMHDNIIIKQHASSCILAPELIELGHTMGNPEGFSAPSIL